MEKTGKNIKVWTLLLLVLISAVFSFNSLIFTLTQTDILKGEPVSGIVINENYSDFVNALSAMTSQYPIKDNAIVFLDKNDDLTIDESGNYLITEQTFANAINNDVDLVTNLQPKSVTNFDIVPSYELSELASQNGYKINNGENNVILTRKFATKRLIVKTDNQNFDAYNAASVLKYKNFYILQYNTEHEASQAYDYFLNCTSIEYVNVDELYWVEDGFGSQSDEDNFVTFGLGDSFSYTSWGAEEMGVPAYSQYLNDLIKANNDYTELEEVVIAVLDTGIDTDHPWFKNRLLTDEEGKYVGLGTDTTYESTTEYAFEDDQGHGTHCAGIICDMTLPNVKILPIKFIYLDEKGEGVGLSSGIKSAMEYIIEMKKIYNIVAVNMSFGGESGSVNLFTEVIKNAYEDEIFSVVAAGNDRNADGSNEEEANVANYSPANIEQAITVSALDPDLKSAYYSNLGDLVDVCAPGSAIESAWPNNCIAESSGTSMAAPHVAAYIALLRSDPEQNYSMDDIEQILKGEYDGLKTIKDLGAEGKDQYYGYGLPILEGLTPDYFTVNIEVGKHGSVSTSGFNLYPKGETVTLEFFPDDQYYVSAVYLDGELLEGVKNVSTYDFTNLNGEHVIHVEFATDEAIYTVNHYWEPLYDLTEPSPTYDKYELHESEILFGRFNDLTEAQAKDYTGFTLANDFEQQTLIKNTETEINIYYARNRYMIYIQEPEEGVDGISGAGEYLYGATVKLTPSLKDEYTWFTWALLEENLVGNFNRNKAQQTFTMPASDLTFTGYTELKTFLVSVEVVGEGNVTPGSKSVKYGDVITFNFSPNEKYILKSVQINGEELNLTDLIYTTGPITQNLELSVYFEKVASENDPYQILKDIDFSFIEDNINIICIILFGVPVLIFVFALRKKK